MIIKWVKVEHGELITKEHYFGNVAKTVYSNAPNNVMLYEKVAESVIGKVYEGANDGWALYKPIVDDSENPSREELIERKLDPNL
jgi:hypothetical protein